MLDLLTWLNYAVADDIVYGATFVGDARGTHGTDWQINDAEELADFIASLDA